MKSINPIFLLSVIMTLTAALIYSPVAVIPVLAAPPDPCFGSNCRDSGCANSPERLTATCCWTAASGKFLCQTCEVNTGSGEFENCTEPAGSEKGPSDSTTILTPPSGKAPPPSTEKCPDNSATDNNGNCTPLAQSPDEGPMDDNNEPFKPEFPRGNILGESQMNQDLQPQP